MKRAIATLGMLLTPAVGWARASFAVVEHRSNPVRELRFSELRAYFTGTATQWPDGSKVVLVERDPRSPAFQFLIDRLVKMSPRDYRRGLMNIEYRGETPVTLKILNTEGAACKFVFNVPGAIALIETDSLATAECSGVQLVRIDGKLPGEEGYRLK